MDVEIYEVVLSYRRGQRLSPEIEFGFNEAQLALRQDMAAGRLIWYDNLLQDWWCFLRNTHPVFAAFASHQLHVVGKIERYWIYGMLICAYWLMAALAVETRECLLEPTCDPLKLAASAEGFFTHVTLLAVDATGRPEGYADGGGALASGGSGGYHAGAGLLMPSNSSSGLGMYGGADGGLGVGALLGAGLEGAHPSLGREPPDMYMCCLVEDIGLVRMYRSLGGGFVSLTFAVLTVVLGQLWFLLAACGCCQFARPAVRHRWERVSHALLFTCGLVGLTSFAIAYNYMARARLLGAAWLNFCLVKGVSICGAFFLQSLLFLALYRKQRAMSDEQLALRFNVTVADVRKCNTVRQKLGLPPLDLSFRWLNAVLPDIRNSKERWRLYLRGLELPQLISLSGWCVCTLWLAATLIAGGTLIAVYVEHHRHYYPQLYRYAQQSAGADGSGGGRGGEGALLYDNTSLPILDVIRGASATAASDALQAGASLLAAADSPLPADGLSSQGRRR